MLAKTTKQTATAAVVVCFWLLIVWELVLQRNPDKTMLANYAFNVGIAAFYLIVFVVAMAKRRNYGKHSTVRSAVTLFGFAGLSWGIAFLIWAYYNLFQAQAIPYPSLADVFFLVAYPMLGVALWRLHRGYGAAVSQKSMAQAVVVIIAAAVLILAFLNRPDLSADLGLSKNLLNVTYSLGDVLLLTGAILEFRSGQLKRHPGLLFLIGFLLLQVAADSLFAYNNNAGIYWNGDLSDFLFGSSGFLFALCLASDSLTGVKKRNSDM